MHIGSISSSVDPIIYLSSSSVSPTISSTFESKSFAVAITVPVLILILPIILLVILIAIRNRRRRMATITPNEFAIRNRRRVRITPNKFPYMMLIDNQHHDYEGTNVPTSPPNPFPHVTNSQQNMTSSEIILLLNETCSQHSRHSNCSAVDEPQIPIAAPKKLEFGSQSKLETSTESAPHLPDLEAVDYADPPNSNVYFMDELEILECNSNGGRYDNSVHDIHVEVPKGAVPEGMSVKLEIGVALFGAFLFPVGMKAVSPILWLCTRPKQFMFHLPIEVELPHCLQLTSLEDITSLQLGFLKGGHNSDDKGNIPFRYSGRAKFQPRSSYGAIRTKHLCYLCLTANYTSPQFCPRTLFCLIRVVPRPIYCRTWDINFCVSMFLKTCIEVSSL